MRSTFGKVGRCRRAKTSNGLSAADAKITFGTFNSPRRRQKNLHARGRGDVTRWSVFNARTWRWNYRPIAAVGVAVGLEARGNVSAHPIPNGAD